MGPLRTNAKSAAREAESPALIAHAFAEQSFVLIDIGEVDHALDQLAHAREVAEGAAPPLLRAWLAAAHGEGLSASGQRDSALRTFDTADTLILADPVDAELPFLFLADTDLDRWRGNALGL